MRGKRHIVVPDMWRGKPPLSKVLAGALMVGALSSSARAEDMGARSLGRGGVGRADGADVAGEEANLAAASLNPQYIMYGGGDAGPDGRFGARVGAMDSRTSAVALGAGYRWLIDNVPPNGAALPGWKPAGTELTNPTTANRVHLGVAVPLLDRRLSIAAHTQFDWEESELTGPDNAFNFGFSVAGRPLPQLTLAIGARELLDTGYARTSREADVSVRYDPGPYLGIEADVVAPLMTGFSVDTFEYRAGVDVSATRWLSVRGGWSLASAHHFAHAGLALVSDKASIDYGIKLQLDAPERHWHALDLRVVF